MAASVERKTSLWVGGRDVDINTVYNLGRQIGQPGQYGRVRRGALAGRAPRSCSVGPHSGSCGAALSGARRTQAVVAEKRRPVEGEPREFAVKIINKQRFRGNKKVYQVCAAGFPRLGRSLTWPRVG
jgi:hypothetical protein